MASESIAFATGVQALAGSTYFGRRVAVNSQCSLLKFPLSTNRYASGLKPIEASGVSSNGVAIGGKRKSGWHEIELAVREYELDQYGVVNNGVYSNYCQIAHCELLKRMDITSYGIDSGEALALSELSLKFISPLKSGDRFLIRVKISSMTGARLSFQEHIIKLPNEQAILEANATAVWLDTNYRPVRLPREVRSKVNRFISETKSEQE
ncbi:hypothetical protein Leryth_027410 [Lithospermum erythrorhizon]|nr:hypothetical protein Leryth_027410 [Lithospermum erythrorhizon]